MLSEWAIAFSVSISDEPSGCRYGVMLSEWTSVCSDRKLILFDPRGPYLPYQQSSVFIIQVRLHPMQTKQRFKRDQQDYTICQCSSVWLEHSPCKRKVVGSDPIIGFYSSHAAAPAAHPATYAKNAVAGSNYRTDIHELGPHSMGHLA